MSCPTLLTKPKKNPNWLDNNPACTDCTDSGSKGIKEDTSSKAVRTIEHGARFSRKLQRRLTRRTFAEARALKEQGTECIHVLLYVVELVSLFGLFRDFTTKIKTYLEFFFIIKKTVHANSFSYKNDTCFFISKTSICKFISTIFEIFLTIKDSYKKDSLTIFWQNKKFPH